MFKNYGTEWRRYRRAFHDQFLPKMLTQYEPVLLRVNHNLVRNLLETPEKFSYHIKLYVPAAAPVCRRGIFRFTLLTSAFSALSPRPFCASCTAWT